MEENDKTTLYLTQPKEGDWYVSNWPGTLKIPVCRKWSGRHNIAKVVYYVEFVDHVGNVWQGRNYGEDTQICHCRKLRKG